MRWVTFFTQMAGAALFHSVKSGSWIAEKNHKGLLCSPNPSWIQFMTMPCHSTAVLKTSTKNDSTRVNRRILVIDDNQAIHDDFKKILCGESAEEDLTAVEEALFGEEAVGCSQPHFQVDSANQGHAGLALVEAALKQGHPYAMAFVDMRMPPGWDGVETIERLWKADPDLQVVICTAFSDHQWDQVTQRLGHSEKLLILRKPFDMIEVRQLADSLTHKWNLALQAEQYPGIIGDGPTGVAESPR